MPLAQDFLSRAVNVQWGGLAVDFLDGANFLKNSNGFSSSTKAVISIWFRIPQSSYEAAVARSATIDEIMASAPSAYFWGAVPVITFGPTGETSSLSIFEGRKVSSTWIGACWNPINGGNDFGLAFHLQFKVVGDASEPDILSGWSEYISVGITYDASTLSFFPPLIPVAADKWHHLLMSWDLSGIISVTGITTSEGGGELTSGIGSTVKIYVALDDVNITGTEQFGSLGGYQGGNGFITQNAFNILTSDRFDPPPTFSWTPTAPPMSGDPLGLPTAGLAEFNPHCELAEFQMWTGVKLDTGDTANRRAFIDVDGQPVSPGKAEELLGKPDLLLHGSGSWKNGHNAGSAGVTPDGEDIPEGQFAPTGDIKTYKPDPSLHGKQS